MVSQESCSMYQHCIFYLLCRILLSFLPIRGHNTEGHYLSKMFCSECCFNLSFRFYNKSFISVLHNSIDVEDLFISKYLNNRENFFKTWNNLLHISYIFFFIDLYNSFFYYFNFRLLYCINNALVQLLFFLWI